MKAYSIDLREKIVLAYSQGDTSTKIKNQRKKESFSLSLVCRTQSDRLNL
ncbi:hypothetical protein [Scytonema sp. NUACC26]